MSQIYTSASNVLGKLFKGEGGIKTLSFGGSGRTLNRAAYALVCETIRYKMILEKLLTSHSPNLFKDPLAKRVDRNLILVMVYDLLFGKGSIQGGGAVKKLVMAHQNALNTAMVMAKVRAGVADAHDLLPPQLRRDTLTPRYARINTLHTSVEAVEWHFAAKGMVFRDLADAELLAEADADEDEQKEDGADTKAVRKDPNPVHRVEWKDPESGALVVYRDNLVPDLLLLAPGTDLHNDALVLDGSLILQDKASCFSALALAELMKEHGVDLEAPQGGAPGPRVIDGCAAPGNKTLHIAALLNKQWPTQGDAAKGKDSGKARAKDGGKGKGQAQGPKAASAKVMACEIDPRRHEVLSHRVQQYHGAEAIHAHLGSFLELDPADYPGVKGLLLDPTCSGSGMVQRLDFWLRELNPDSGSSGGSSGKAGRGGGGEEPAMSSLEVDGVRPDVRALTSDAADAADQPASAGERVENLADFQVSVIEHAMGFPAAECIVYSTCSVHTAENEGVVARVLARHSDEWELARVLPGWHRRGFQTPDLPNGDLTVRCSPHEDHLLGFYVAGFVRRRRGSGAGSSASGGQLPKKLTGGKRRSPDAGPVPPQTPSPRSEEAAVPTVGGSESLSPSASSAANPGHCSDAAAAGVAEPAKKRRKKNNKNKKPAAPQA